jgi:hypothetical protein
MKKIFFSFFSFFSLLFIYSCSTSKKIDAIKPLPTDDSPIAFKNSTSFVNMPLEITLKEIENQLNKKLTDLIYDDNDLNDDKTMMKIWKTAPIQLTEKNGIITSILPLKIWSKFKYGTDFMGLNDTREINLNGTIIIESTATLSNWKLSTISTIKDFEWSESPSILIGGKSVAITYIINPTLSIFKGKLAKKIDKAIAESCDFKPFVIEVLRKLSNPILTSEQYQAWFKMMPNEVYVTDAVLKDSKVNMNLGLKCTMQTMIGEQPKINFNEKVIDFKAVSSIPDKVVANIAAVSTYQNASKLITTNFRGKEFTSGSRKIVINQVNLWNRAGKIIIALEMNGSIDGTIYLSGIPNYNALTKEIYFDQMDYVLDSKGILTKTANWLLQGMILKKIESNCRYSIKENLDEGKNSLLFYFNNYSPMKGVIVNGTVNDFEIDKVEITDKAMICFIKTSGKMKISIDGMD